MIVLIRRTVEMMGEAPAALHGGYIRQGGFFGRTVNKERNSFSSVFYLKWSLDKDDP
jgi:hypothetical protein